MTRQTASEDVAYDYDLEFWESECGSGSCVYYGLITDYHTPADILIRVDWRKDPEHEQAKALAQEVVKRWNAYTPSVAESPSGDMPIVDFLSVFKTDFMKIKEALEYGRVNSVMGARAGFQKALNALENIMDSK